MPRMVVGVMLVVSMMWAGLPMGALAAEDAEVADSVEEQSDSGSEEDDCGRLAKDAAESLRTEIGDQEGLQVGQAVAERTKALFLASVEALAGGADGSGHDSLRELYAGAQSDREVADVFSLIARELDIPCVVVEHSPADQDSSAYHAWNLVEVDGSWYHVDVWAAVEDAGALPDDASRNDVLSRCADKWLLVGNDNANVADRDYADWSVCDDSDARGVVVSEADYQLPDAAAGLETDTSEELEESPQSDAATADEEALDEVQDEETPELTAMATTVCSLGRLRQGASGTALSDFEILSSEGTDSDGNTRYNVSNSAELYVIAQNIDNELFGQATNHVTLYSGSTGSLTKTYDSTWNYVSNNKAAVSLISNALDGLRGDYRVDFELILQNGQSLGKVTSLKICLPYSVFFNANGGDVSTVGKSVFNGSAYGTLPTPSRSNYTFDGWYTSSSGGTKIASSSIVSLSANQTLYAHWKAVSSLASCTMTLSPSSYTYDGSQKNPTIVVKDGSTTLKEGTHYTVTTTPSGRTNVGTYTYVVTGKGSYAGTGTKSASFKITAASISGATIAAVSDQTYTGSAIKPTPSVTVGGRTLVSGSDFTYFYSNNTNAGTATITVTGRGNYTGTATKTFKIVAKKTAFAWGRDNWNFNNTGATGKPDYFPGKKYIDQINSTYLNKLKKSLTNDEYWWVFTGGRWANGKYYEPWIYDSWGGSCYGMASTTLLAKRGLLPYSQYKSGATTLTQLPTPKASSDVSSLITYYQMLQVKDRVQGRCRQIAKRSNRENIEEIISLLDEYGVVLLGVRQESTGFSHAILAYGHETGSYTKGGVTYQGRILICDPNCSMNNKDDYYLYYNTRSYQWEIPHYRTSANMRSSQGAYISNINADAAMINEGGYLGGGAISDGDAIARLDAPSISENRSISKVAESSGSYVQMYTAPGDIEEDRSFVYSGTDKGTPGYNLYDTEASYRVRQEEPINLDLIMNYEDCLMTASSVAGEAAVFDRNGYVEVTGESADYALSITSNADYPTDWFTVSVRGSGADKASLEKVANGYVVQSDSLKNVEVEANNKNVSAQASFSTKYDEALIYEIGERTIGIKVDADGNGSYETPVSTTSKYDMSRATISSIADQSYTGSAIKPAPTVKLGGVALKSGTDYTLSYKNNVSTGTATVTVTGKGSYAGTVKTTFKIKPASISGATVSAIAEQGYTGSAIKPTPTVKLSGTTLKKDTDYTLSYKANTKVGTATVTVTGKGNYAGTKSVTFKIVDWVGASRVPVSASAKYTLLKGGYMRVKSGGKFAKSDSVLSISGWTVTGKKAGKTTLYLFDSKGKQVAKKTVEVFVAHGKTYEFESSVDRNYVLDIQGGSKKDGAQMIVYKRNNGKNQRYQLYLQSDGTYAIRSLNSKKWLTVESKTNKYVQQWAWKKGNNTDQRWRLTVDSANRVTFVNVKTNKCFDVQGGKTKNSAKMIVWQSNNGLNQKWRLNQK